MSQVEVKCRKKTMVYDGLELVIAPITLNYLKAFSEKTISWYEVLCWSMNRASGKQDWTVDRIREEFDAALAQKLKEDILEFSGLTAVFAEDTKAPPGEPPGEKPAVSEI